MKTTRLVFLTLIMGVSSVAMAQQCDCQVASNPYAFQRDLQRALDYLYSYDLDRMLDRQLYIAKEREMLVELRHEVELMKQFEKQRAQIAKLEELINQQMQLAYKQRAKLTKEQEEQYRREKELITRRLNELDRQLMLLATYDADACFVAYLIKTSSFNQKYSAEVKERFTADKLMNYIRFFSENDLLLLSRGHNVEMNRYVQ